MRKRKILDKISQFFYKNLYNKHKYIKAINHPLVHAFIYPIYSLFNLFYFHSVLKFYKKHIEKLIKDTQFFFIGRRDLGTHLYMLHYLVLWTKKRGKASLLIFTREPQNILHLAKILIPDVSIIYPNRSLDYLATILFGHYYVYSYTLLPVYSYLVTQYPNFIHLFDLAEISRANYNVFLDPLLSHPSCELLPDTFIETYKQIRKQCDYRWDVFKDCFSLNNQMITPKVQVDGLLRSLKKKLNIQKPYVLLNINTKNYQGSSARRTIKYPERYNSIIDSLIEKGYEVILQGRKEQPYFEPRKGLIDYSKSAFHSIEHDLALYAGCEFVISNKSGIEIFATICNIPILGLNYTELLGMHPAKKLRFYPKFLRNLQTGKMLSWQEHLISPHFFEIGVNTYGETVDYIEMNAEQMVEALNEFLPFLDGPEDQWESHTILQKQFKASLTPLHMELYLAKSVPCDAYLKSSNPCDSNKLKENKVYLSCGGN